MMLEIHKTDIFFNTDDVNVIILRYVVNNTFQFVSFSTGSMLRTKTNLLVSVYF